MNHRPRTWQFSLPPEGSPEFGKSFFRFFVEGIDFQNGFQFLFCVLDSLVFFVDFIKLPMHGEKIDALFLGKFKHVAGFIHSIEREQGIAQIEICNGKFRVQGQSFFQKPKGFSGVPACSALHLNWKVPG